MYDIYSSAGKTGKLIAEIGGKVDNMAWLYDKLRRGYTVVDIGIDATRVARSSSYMFEQILLWSWKKRNTFKWFMHLL